MAHMPRDGIAIHTCASHMKALVHMAMDRCESLLGPAAENSDEGLYEEEALLVS